MWFVVPQEVTHEAGRSGLTISILWGFLFYGNMGLYTCRYRFTLLILKHTNTTYKMKGMYAPFLITINLRIYVSVNWIMLVLRLKCICSINYSVLSFENARVYCVYMYV